MSTLKYRSISTRSAIRQHRLERVQELGIYKIYGSGWEPGTYVRGDNIGICKQVKSEERQGLEVDLSARA